MRNALYLILIFIGLTACDKPFNEKPENLLSKSEMADVMVDYYLSQQMISGSQVKDGNYPLALAENMYYIFDKHNVSREDFEENYRYYYTKPKEFQKILDRVKDQLSDQLSEEEKQKQAQIQKEQE